MYLGQFFSRLNYVTNKKKQDLYICHAGFSLFPEKKQPFLDMPLKPEHRCTNALTGSSTLIKSIQNLFVFIMKLSKTHINLIAYIHTQEMKQNDFCPIFSLH